LCKQVKVWGDDGSELVHLFGVKESVFMRLVALSLKMDKFENLSESQWESVDRLCSIMAKAIRGTGEDTDELLLSIPHEKLTLLQKALMAIYSGSESAYKFLMQKIGALEDSRLSALYTPGGMSKNFTVPTNYKGLLNTAVKYTYKHSGVKDVHLPFDVRAEVRESDPDGYKTYLAVCRDINAVFKDALRQVVRSSGKPILDITVVIKELKRMGVYNKLPSSFVGSIDDQNRYYTKEGSLLLGSPTGEVSMNPAWEDDHSAYYCTYFAPGAAAPSKLYQADVVQARKSAKFDATRLMVDKLEVYRKQWLRDLRQGGENEIPALLCEIAYLVSPRIGTEGNSTKVDGKNIKTYGISTIRVSHVKATSTSVTIKYVGKAGEQQEHFIDSSSTSSRLVVAKIKSLISGRERSDYVFSDDGSTTYGSKVNVYLKSLGVPEKFRFHGFRKVRGSFIMKEYLAGFNAEGYSSKDVNDFVQEGLKAVGEQLGHFSKGKVTGATALKSYIDGDILHSFYTKVKVRPTATIEKAIQAARSET
jgi:DNA topoisomerase IB